MCVILWLQISRSTVDEKNKTIRKRTLYVPLRLLNYISLFLLLMLSACTIFGMFRFYEHNLNATQRKENVYTRLTMNMFIPRTARERKKSHTHHREPIEKCWLLYFQWVSSTSLCVRCIVRLYTRLNFFSSILCFSVLTFGIEELFLCVNVMQIEYRILFHPLDTTRLTSNMERWRLYTHTARRRHIAISTSWVHARTRQHTAHSTHNSRLPFVDAIWATQHFPRMIISILHHRLNFPANYRKVLTTNTNIQKQQQKKLYIPTLVINYVDIYLLCNWVISDAISVCA